MAGSRYTIYSSYGFSETPFGKLEAAVYGCLKKNGIIEVTLGTEAVDTAGGIDFYDVKFPVPK
jgi:hypothetical protein